MGVGGLAAGSSAASGEVVMRGGAAMGTSPLFPDSAPAYRDLKDAVGLRDWKLQETPSVW